MSPLCKNLSIRLFLKCQVLEMLRLHWLGNIYSSVCEADECFLECLCLELNYLYIKGGDVWEMWGCCWSKIALSTYDRISSLVLQTCFFFLVCQRTVFFFICFLCLSLSPSLSCFLLLFLLLYFMVDLAPVIASIHWLLLFLRWLGNDCRARRRERSWEWC